MSRVSRDHGPKSPARGPRRARLKLEGDGPLLRSLRNPLRRALARRPAAPYRVRVQEVGECGEVLVSITTARGPMPLRFAADELDPGFLASVIRNSLDRFGL